MTTGARSIGDEPVSAESQAVWDAEAGRARRVLGGVATRWALRVVAGTGVTVALIWIVFPRATDLARATNPTRGRADLWWAAMALVASGLAIGAVVLLRNLHPLIGGIPAAVILVGESLLLAGTEPPWWLSTLTDRLLSSFGAMPFVVAGVLGYHCIHSAIARSRPDLSSREAVSGIKGR
ncbi:MAG TPA: hypothetical protein VGC47_08835 [Acidimicrobiia bacterium]